MKIIEWDQSKYNISLKLKNEECIKIPDFSRIELSFHNNLILII